MGVACNESPGRSPWQWASLGFMIAKRGVWHSGAGFALELEQELAEHPAGRVATLKHG